MDTEHEPLLDQEDSQAQTPEISITHVAKALAALRAGALPSSDQLASLLRSFLHSPVLQVEGTIWTPEYGHGRLGVGELTREGEEVRAAVREVTEALLRTIVEKDSDDRCQDFIVALRKSEVDIKLPSTKGAPSSELRQQARQSLFNVFVVFVSSPELRALLADAVLLIGSTFDDAVRQRGPLGEKAGHVADEVATGLAEKMAGDVPRKDKGKAKMAEDVEERAAVEELLGDEKVPGEQEEEASVPAPELTEEEVRDQFIDRLKTILTLVQKHPSYQASVHTIFILARSYTRALLDSLSVDASVHHPESIPSPIALLVPVLEPFAGGPNSLAPLAASLHRLKQYAHSENRVQVLISTFDTFLEHALVDTGYIGSSLAHRQAASIHDQLINVARDNPAFRADCSVFFLELQNALLAISNDRALRALVGGFGHLALALEGWTEKAAKIAVGKDGVWGDVIEWVVPRIAGFLRQVPLPRVEFSSPSIDIALDPPPFIKTSFVPDTIRFDNASSFILTPATTAHPTKHDYSANSQLTVTGVRMETEVGYFLRYRNACFNFTESGLLDLKFGTAKDGGVGAKIDFSTIEDEDQLEKKRLFDVVTSDISITSFDLVPHASSHPWLLFFIRPILRRIVRNSVELALQEQVKHGLETASRIGWEVKRKAGSGIVGWFGGLYEVMVEGSYKDEEPTDETPIDEAKDKAYDKATDKAADAAQPEEGEGPHVHVSGKGVSIDLEAGTVGVGAEGIVLPEGEAETPAPRPSVIEVVKEDVVGAVREGKAKAEAVLEGFGELGEAVQEFPEEVKKEEVLVEAGGWRSEAFDFV